MFSIMIQTRGDFHWFSRSQVPAIGEHIRFTEDGRFYTVKRVEWQYFMNAEYDVIVFVE